MTKNTHARQEPGRPRSPASAAPCGSARAAAGIAGAAALVAFLAAPAALSAQLGVDEVPLNGKTVDWLVSSAVLAAPAPLRDGAEVRGWTSDDRLVTLRPGTNGLICLADRPGDEGFAAACYHEGLEPFMERGRELSRAGVQGTARNEARWAEIRAGTLPMPVAGMVYNLGFPTEDFDPAATDPATGRRLNAMYMTGATPESTGLPAAPGDGPWLMFPGTPSAHVMIALPPKEEPRD